MSAPYEATLAWAQAQDAADPLRPFRDEFHIPPHEGRDSHYFCGNSLGLQPRAVRPALNAELDDWAELGVEGAFQGPHCRGCTTTSSCATTSPPWWAPSPPKSWR